MRGFFSTGVKQLCTMQGKKQYTEKLFSSFQLSEYVPKENIYRRLREQLELKFIYSRTTHLYGSTGNPGIDPVVFFTRKDCRECPFKKTCLGKVAQEKKLELSYYQEEYERAWKRQQTKHFKRMVRVRAGTVEPVFGNLINYYGLRKINTKGKAGAHKCMLMSAIAFNLKKLMKFLNKKLNVKVVALQGQQLAFLKSLFAKVISSKISYLVFSTPQLRFK